MSSPPPPARVAGGRFAPRAGAARVLWRNELGGVTWDLGDGTTSTDSLPVHTYTVEGQYDVRLTVMTDSGCIDTVSLLRPAAVQVWVPPTAGLYTSTPVVDVLNPDVTVRSRGCLLYTSPSPRDRTRSRMPSSA